MAIAAPNNSITFTSSIAGGTASALNEWEGEEFFSPENLTNRADQGGFTSNVSTALENGSMRESRDIDAENHWRDLLEYRPRTLLGAKLLELRKRYIASGGKLLTSDEIAKELGRDRLE